MRCSEIELGKLLNVTMAGITNLASSASHPARILREYVAYFILRGELELMQNGKSLLLSAGDVRIFAPGESQSAIACRDCEYAYFHFSANEASPIDYTKDELCTRIVNRRVEFSVSSVYTDTPYQLMQVCLPEQFRVDGAFLSHTKTVFSTSSIRYGNHTAQNRLRISCEVSLLLMKLENLILTEFQGGYKGKLGKTHEAVAKILSFIEANYDKPFTAKDVESALFINYDYANRLFKKHCGMSIIRYRNKLRISTAKALLTTVGIDEAVSASGFSDKYYFNRLFKKLVGCSPEQYVINEAQLHEN